MSTTNAEIINEPIASEDKSLPRVINFSSPGDLPKLDTKKSAALACDSEGKNCANSSKIPRTPTASYSFNETLKSNQSKGKIKKAPSMIPRSKSRKQKENDKERVKFDVPSKPESQKNQLNNTSAPTDKRSNNELTVEDSETIVPLDQTHNKSCFLVADEDKNLGQKLLNASDSDLKSCQDFVDAVKNSTDMSYKEVQEGDPENRAVSRKEQEIDGPLISVKTGNDRENQDRKEVREERAVRNLYDAMKNATGPVFDNYKPNESGNERLYSDNEDVNEDDATQEDFSSVQGHYEFTLKEISNIWKNTISLIGSVRDHAIQFVEENNELVDKEQLSLEAEMLQLALDLAISYSKLKMDSLIKLVKKRLKVKKLKKSELENFMESKTFCFLYSNDDLAEMARTVQDLNTSLLKGEDLELE